MFLISNTSLSEYLSRLLCCVFSGCNLAVVSEEKHQFHRSVQLVLRLLKKQST